MRILHVSDCYLPRTGGIELHVRDLASRQRAAGAEVTVATVTAGTGPAGGSVIRLPAVAGFPHPRALAQLRRLVESGGWDVVHAHSSLVSPLARWGVRAASAAGTPVVVTMHSMLPTGAAAQILRTVAPQPSPSVTWTAVSTAAAASLQGVLPGQVVTVLPNGVDPQEWAPERTERVPRPRTIVSVMRTARRKRPLQLVDMLRAVRDRVPPTQPLRAVLVGSGPLDGAIRRRLAATGLDAWVTQAGQLDRREIRDLLHRSDLYLAPAELESFGIAALEARCAGLPVIGMAGSGISDFIRHGTEGFLVDSDAAMARQAAQLLTDPVQLDAIQQHNRTNLPAISWPRVLDLHWRTYHAACTAAGRPAPARRVESLAGLAGS